VGVDYNELVQALYLARSEAVKGATLVTVCARKSPDSDQCSTQTKDEDWKNGWLVFIDNKAATAESYAILDPEDELIAQHSEQRSSNYITNSGATSLSESPSAGSYVKYNAEGKANWAVGTFMLCDAEHDTSRAVNIALTGDIRPARDNNGDKVIRNAFNQPACPT